MFPQTSLNMYLAQETLAQPPKILTSLGWLGGCKSRGLESNLPTYPPKPPWLKCADAQRAEAARSKIQGKAFP